MALRSPASRPSHFREVVYHHLRLQSPLESLLGLVISLSLLQDSKQEKELTIATCCAKWDCVLSRSGDVHTGMCIFGLGVEIRCFVLPVIGPSIASISIQCP